MAHVGKVASPLCIMSRADDPLTSKLYRYLFFGWLLQRPRGDLFLRQSLRRANIRALNRWLPHYARVHAVLALLSGTALWALGEITADGLWLALAGFVFMGETLLTMCLASALIASLIYRYIGDLGDGD